MMSVQADLTGLGSYIGTVDGILQAVEDPRFEGDFTEHMMDSVSSTFMVETIAAKHAGKRISHVFEWGDQQGETTDEPLFMLTRMGTTGNRKLSYMFLPSKQYVPLPDPGRYGFKAEKLKYLRRHVFQLKALVMETRNRVTVAPVGAKKLFVPDADAKRGYYMTSNPTKINPGGAGATGGFAAWWNEWFSTRAQAVVNEEVQSTEDWLVATGAKYVRYAAGTVKGGKKVGGQFASGRAVSAGYINSKSRSVKESILKESKAMFDRDKWESQWDWDGEE